MEAPTLTMKLFCEYIATLHFTANLLTFSNLTATEMEYPT
jgi:hypothetical protein